MKQSLRVVDIEGEEHDVEVEYDTFVLSEDEAYAEISTIWSLYQNRELMENEITPKSYAALQEKLDSSIDAHSLYYEEQMSRAYDRAKDRMKYGD